VFYAFSFPLHLVRNPVAKAYSVYSMIDEAYAVSASLPAAQQSAARLLAMQIACQIYWVGGGLVGVVIGTALPAPIKGLEFSLCALFTVLTLDAWRSRREAPTALLAAASVAAALVIAPRTALIVALLIFVAMLVVRYAVAVRRGTIQDAVDA